jgi:hypothetical protein
MSNHDKKIFCCQVGNKTGGGSIMHQRLFAILLPLALLLGCQAVKVGDLDSPFFAPPKDSTVILYQNLAIRIERGRANLVRNSG